MASSIRNTCLLALAVVALASCRQAPGPVFRHDAHLERGPSCGDCHAQGGVLPTVETCAACHAEATQNVTPEQVAGILEGRGARRGAFGLVFSHEKHAGAACGDCHAGDGPRMKRPGMQTCLSACHGAEGGYPIGCDKCHATLDARGRPASHAPAEWDRSHGSEARAAGETCRSCHQENTCFSCHRSSRPADHNQHFRLRGHGVQAQGNRERCLACHRQESCTRCHLGTRPITHTSAWKTRPVFTHCTSCHIPLSNTSCATCHVRFNQTHPGLAPNQPATAVHVPGAFCRDCHKTGGVGPLNHKDNGDDCAACHAT